jgi:hypothetical protein
VLAQPGTVPEGEDCYEAHAGFQKVYFCTPEFLVKVIRALWDQKINHQSDPFLAFLYRPDNCIYEGLKLDTWDSGGDKPTQVKCKMLGNPIPYSFVVNEIAEVTVA